VAAIFDEPPGVRIVAAETVGLRQEDNRTD
jgi:hypothetical protein